MRDAGEYFDDIQDVKITKDILNLAKHIVEQKSEHFKLDKFEDHYETALQELLNKKQKGLPVTVAKNQTPSNVVDLMSALKASIQGGRRTPAEQKSPKPKKSKPAAKRKAS